jgi:hypothetical protein
MPRTVLARLRHPNWRGEVPVRVTATVSAAPAKAKPKADGDFDQTRATGAPRA